MPVAWPATLNNTLDVDSFSYKIGDTTIRSDMDIGPQKVRRRHTKSVDTISCSQKISFSLYQDLYDFFDIDLNGGVNTFSFNHPFTGLPMECRFLGPPEIRPIGGVEFTLSMQWEIVP